MELPAQEDVPQLPFGRTGPPSKPSAVIHLFYYEGYSIKEISEILKLPASTVGAALPGTEKLKELLKEDASWNRDDYRAALDRIELSARASGKTPFRNSHGRQGSKQKGDCFYEAPDALSKPACWPPLWRSL